MPGFLLTNDKMFPKNTKLSLHFLISPRFFVIQYRLKITDDLLKNGESLP